MCIIDIINTQNPETRPVLIIIYSDWQMNRGGKFPEELVKKLLVLEDYFHRKTLTLDAVNELVGCYVQSVEQF